MKRQIAVIGGGASGLAAAISAAKAGAQVTILERLPRVGKKILLTGNGRCNLGNLDLSQGHYHGTLPQAAQILAKQSIGDYFRGMGLLIRADAEGRLYPRSMTAASVLDALRFAADKAGVQTLCETRVTDIRPQKYGFVLVCETPDGKRDIRADAVIAAAGGAAAPSCGTDGSLYPVLERLGHKIIKPLPALCPVPVQSACLRQLKGIRVRAAVSAVRGGRVLKTEPGEIQFTETALSGICVFNLSRLTAIHGRETVLSVDLCPELGADAVSALLRELISQRGHLPNTELLSGVVPKRIGEVLMKSCGLPLNAPASGLNGSDLAGLGAIIKAWEFPVSGQACFAQAQVTAGGVAGQSVTKTLESRVCPGLYFCGELLDLDGDCGGFNLAWAWSSGDFAGKNAALKNE